MDVGASGEQNEFYKSIVERARMPGVTIKKRIGGGSFGNVFLGVDEEGKERAYKIFIDNDFTDVEGVDPSIMDPTFISFAREAGIYKRLGNRNPGICTVDEIGAGYITMRLAEVDLADEIKEIGGPSNLEDLLTDMVTLLTTIEIMHDEGVVHLDLKPGNILRCKDGSLKICDLGAAVIMREHELEKFLEAKRQYPKNKLSLEDLSLIDGRITGIYAPPENFVSNESNNGLTPLYPVADIWSLGAVFFEMITGIRFSSLLYNTKYPDFKIMTRHVLKGLVNPLDFLSFITDDMNIEGFAVYSPQWREYLGKLDQDKVNNISPGNLVYIRAYSDKTHRVSDMWDLIKRMLDPNPFTRMTATECLDHAVFEDGYLQDIRKRMWGVYLSRDLPQEYKISPTYRPSLFYKITRRRTLSNKGKSIQDMDSITYALSLFPDIETRFFRLFSVIDSMVRNVPNTDFGAFTFCILTLAIYAEYGLFYRKPHTLSESWFESNLKNNLMVHESIVSMFLPNFTDDLRNSRIRISIMFRFLLVDLLQFNLWI